MAHHAPSGTADNGNASIASKRRESQTAPHRTGSCRAPLSSHRVLGLIVEDIIGPRLIANHVLGIIGRLVSARASGADAGRYRGCWPVNLSIAEKCQRVALPGRAV